MITEGPEDPNAAIPRKTIADGKKVPNVSIFLKRTCIEFLQILFSQRADYCYDSDDTQTKIQITDAHSLDLSSINIRPAIVVVRGPLEWRGLGLGQGAMEGRNMKTGDTWFNDLLVGSAAVSVFSREGIEAEQIAHIVFNSFKFFRPVLQRYGFFSIKSLSMGGESLIEQSGSNDETYVVPIHISAMIQDRWLLSDKAARTLNDIIIQSLFAAPEPSTTPRTEVLPQNPGEDILPKKPGKRLGHFK